MKRGTSGQDGEVGRHASPSRTKIRRITANLKPKKNQNCQKITQYESPTIKELKKHSSKLVGAAEKGSGAERRHGKVAD